MCGKIKNKGRGRGGANRRKDKDIGITFCTIRRLARLGGVRSVLPHVICKLMMCIFKLYLQNIIRDAVTYANCYKRSTIIQKDIVLSVQRRGLHSNSFQN